MKKLVDIVSIIAVSLLLMYALKKSIQLGKSKPKPSPAAEEQQAAGNAPPPSGTAPMPQDTAPPDIAPANETIAPTKLRGVNFSKSKL